MNLVSPPGPEVLALVLSLLFSVGAGVGGATASNAASPTTSASATAPLAVAVARIDELHKRRDDRAAWHEEQRLVQSTLARAPQDYGVLWRAARFYFWASDDPGVAREQRSRWGKDGWDIAERAIHVNVNDAAGYYWAALCMGNYALGLGVVKALSQGLESKFRDRLGRAQALNGGYEFGGIDTAWGRFYDKLPWPKRDRRKAQEHLRRAIELNPASLRARVYLAVSHLDSDNPKEAKRLLDEVSAAAAGRYDAPEERRAKALAAGLMPDLYAKLK